MSNRRCAMRSLRAEALLLAAALLAANAAGAAAPSRDAVDEAAASLREIPTLVGTQRRHELNFNFGEPPKSEPQAVPAWLLWLQNFFGWLGESGRWLVWLLGAIAAAVAAVRVRVLLLGSGGLGGRDALALPTHVQNLAIRPETLPVPRGPP